MIYDLYLNKYSLPEHQKAELITKGQIVVAYTFNPSIWESYAFNLSTREVERGAIWLGRERNIRQKI